MHGLSDAGQDWWVPHSTSRPRSLPCAGVEYQVQLRVHYHLIIWLIIFQSNFSSSLNVVQIFLFTCADRFSYLKEFHVIPSLHICGSGLSRGCTEVLDVCYLGMPGSSAFCLPSVGNFAKRGVNSGLFSISSCNLNCHTHEINNSFSPKNLI